MRQLPHKLPIHYHLTHASGQSIHLSSQPTTPDELRDAASSIISEEKDKQKRKLNLIIHNMAESNLDQPQSRKEQDIINIRDILSSQLEVQPHITNAIRLGRKRGPKPRPLRITVESDEEKVAILRNVRLSSTPEYLKCVFITPCRPYQGKERLTRLYTQSWLNVTNQQNSL